MLLLLAAGGWAWTLTAGDMGRMAGMESTGAADPALFAGFMIGWVAMMAAMMFPAIILVVRLYGLAAGKGSVAPIPWFVAGYLLVWSAAGIPSYVAWRELEAPLAAAAPWVARLAGVVLLAAAVYQLTPLKTVCLRHCRSPLTFFTHHGRSLRSPARAVRAGLAHGSYCLGCCWLLMAILVAFGTMHLGWMLALGALIVLEKTAPRGEAIARAAAAAFAALGLWLILNPEIIDSLI
ncbi:MAG TPA: DUF2182 domain-containing protein [Gemmatimonadota bacterium]|nr:DUF2182 domain-containing protein [Gemmatimonadota bacterium]